MKLWHDDIRKPPAGWTWARTNAEALEWLRIPGLVDEISLDHDLGLHNADEDDLEAIFLAAPSHEGSGYDLVCTMTDEGLVPPKVTIHSWNPDGAKAMATRLNNHGFDCIVAPFVPKKV